MSFVSSTPPFFGFPQSSNRFAATYDLTNERLVLPRAVGFLQLRLNNVSNFEVEFSSDQTFPLTVSLIRSKYLRYSYLKFYHPCLKYPLLFKDTSSIGGYVQIELMGDMMFLVYPVSGVSSFYFNCLIPQDQENVTLYSTSGSGKLTEPIPDNLTPPLMQLFWEVGVDLSIYSEDKVFIPDVVTITKTNQSGTCFGNFIELYKYPFDFRLAYGLHGTIPNMVNVKYNNGVWKIEN